MISPAGLPAWRRNRARGGRAGAAAVCCERGGLPDGPHCTGKTAYSTWAVFCVNCAPRWGDQASAHSDQQQSGSAASVCHQCRQPQGLGVASGFFQQQCDRCETEWDGGKQCCCCALPCGSVCWCQQVGFCTSAVLLSTIRLAAWVKGGDSVDVA